jgi:hypothetical protein
LIHIHFTTRQLVRKVVILKKPTLRRVFPEIVFYT